MKLSVEYRGNILAHKQAQLLAVHILYIQKVDCFKDLKYLDLLKNLALKSLKTIVNIFMLQLNKNNTIVDNYTYNTNTFLLKFHIF